MEDATLAKAGAGVSGIQRLRLIATFVLFEAAWLACVMGAARGQLGWGIGAIMASIAWQLAFSSRPRIDLKLIAAAFAVGLVWDTLLVQAGLIVYSSHVPFAAVAPLWILALWAQLGSVLREPLRWLHGRPWLGVALGAIGGAAAYAGASRLGACEFPDPYVALGVLAIGWGILLPALIYLAQCMDPARR
jgi:hypothetical protein